MVRNNRSTHFSFVGILKGIAIFILGEIFSSCFALPSPIIYPFIADETILRVLSCYPSTIEQIKIFQIKNDSDRTNDKMIVAVAHPGGMILDTGAPNYFPPGNIHQDTIRIDTFDVRTKSDVSVLIAPAEGFYIDSILIDSVLYNPFTEKFNSRGNRTAEQRSRKQPLLYIFRTIASNQSIIATFAMDKTLFTIAAYCGPGGVIVPMATERSLPPAQPPPPEDANTVSKSYSAALGEFKYFSIVPAQGYDIDSILVDGVYWLPRWNGLGLNQSRWPVCPFENIKHNHTLHVTFHKES
ncbi:MAG: hypothetical protein ACHQQQ_15070 [Bacteroidota bacterium]